ncbi:MAG TPA: hypothetical protein VHY79_09470 [Rhizomicrobium sp.]|jgi:hypothetical protein|nr:hypothetical protein [Rhizomicrobium sp.]
MIRTVFLAAAAVFVTAAMVPVMTANAAPAVQKGKGAKVLWNQNSDSNGGFIVSQNFTSGTYTVDDDQGADDFVVPKGKTWTVTEVDVTGQYFGGSGVPAKSENVFFYKNKAAMGLPGGLVAHGAFKNLPGKDKSGSFSISLGKQGLKLAAGTYWVSVVANCNDTGGCGEWAWETRDPIIGSAAVWQQSNSEVCPTWGTLADCFADTGDFMFDVRGKSK